MVQFSLYSSLLKPDLQQMLQEGDVDGLAEFCNALYAGVVAEVIEELDDEAAWNVLTNCGPERQAEILKFLSLPYQIQLVDHIDRTSLSRIIEEMSPDDRVDLLERLDPGHVESLLPLIAQAERSDIRKLLSYPEDSAGAIMTTEYASLPANITAEEALRRLRIQAPSRETIYYIYITDEGRHLIGFLSLRKLIQSSPETKLAELMERDVISVRVDDDQEFVANEIARFDFIAIPVVDNQNRLVGIVTHDDAADVLLEEAAEDAQLLAAVAPLEDSYLETPFFALARKRGVWLIILLAAASVTAYALSRYEQQEAGNWMVLFIPLVLASGGNAGSQSATLIIRALALDETRGKFGVIVSRELRIALFLGFVIGTLSLLVAYCLVTAVDRALVVGLTVFAVVGIGTFSGSMLPLGLQKLGLDPALMSTPLIAALVDVVGVIIFYEMALRVLG